jgi:hypothetical protein
MVHLKFLDSITNNTVKPNVLKLSQASQDIFPQVVVPNGNTFLDIGSNAPTAYNNSYALEILGWNGKCFDIDDYTNQYIQTRRAKFICADVTTYDWNSILSEMNGIVDYISFDVDEATRPAFDNFPFDTFHCKTLTIEHDAYRFGNLTRDHIRDTLTSYGYLLIFGNVVCDGFGAFEDWFVHPDYIDPAILQKLLNAKCEDKSSFLIHEILVKLNVT